MKAQSMKIVAGTIVLGALLYFLACSSPTPTNNSSQNQNQPTNQNQANANGTPHSDLKACDDYGSDPNPHAQHIKKEIENKMDSSLKKLLKTPTNPDGTFTVEVKRATEPANAKYFVAYIRGKVSGDDNLKELSDILNDFQSKEECLRIVYFLPEGAVTTDGGGFEWIACQYPMVVCPDGTCCMPDYLQQEGSTSSAYSNSSGNTNSNKAANTNANTNSKGSGKKP